MTDRIAGFVVALEHDIREDDVEPLLSAIRHLRGVLSVTPQVSDFNVHIGYERATEEIRRRVYDALRPLVTGR